MANAKHSLLKYFLNCGVFYCGKDVRQYRHFLSLQNKSLVQMNCHMLQSRRHILTTTTLRARQTGELTDSKSKQTGDVKDTVEHLQKITEVDEPAHEHVPLIVKLMIQNQERMMQQESEQKRPNHRLTMHELQKTLEDIKWDADVSKRRTDVEGLVETEDEIEVQTDEQEQTVGLPDMTTIEDIYLDDDVPRVHAVHQKTKKKQKMKGTPDPSIPASDIPCSGCGAVLHCQDPAIPGYMPSEKFTRLTREDMSVSTCQRCFFIQTYNMFLNVRVSAETYPQILQEIKRTKALVLVVVDLFDMKNSTFENLLKHIGTNRPLFIVGNKVDLIPRDSRGYLERTRQALWDMCNSAGLNPTGKNIKHLCLVSAKTGYGIESLITKLMAVWQLKGHVYVVGSTNVGKSTLFNALLMSDYCKSMARGFIRRATVSVWPGTTLNLLKFPIINPAPWRLALRRKRLDTDQREYAAAEDLRRSRLHEFGSHKTDLLKGHVGLTDFRSARTIAETETEAEEQSYGQDFVTFSYSKEGVFEEASHPLSQSTGNKSQDYKPENLTMFWCNDTPGVVNPEQIINLLEPEELVTILPKTKLQPRCVVIRPGQVLFVTGMGRIDYVQGNSSIYLTVYASGTVPLHVKDGAEADDFYMSNLGTAALGIPVGDEDRLSRIPSLIGREFHIIGTEWDVAAADIQLSSLGWVSVAAGREMSVTLRAYTPGGQGLYLRYPALVPNFTWFRGKRIGKTPFYRPALYKL